MKKFILLFLFIPFIPLNCKVLLGIDVLQKKNFSILKGKRVGLITNQTGYDSNLESTINIFASQNQFKLVALFSPEHGINGIYSAGETYGTQIDKRTGLTVYSLYGANRKPLKSMLKNIDILVYDIQDIGIRAYTYISTMGLCMEAAAENNIEFVVLDRPNPLGGIRIEGNIAEENFLSFVSPYKIPYIYGLTCGELARLINDEGMLTNGVKCKLTVIAMQGWKRSMHFEDTGLIWLPTSTHVPYEFTPYYEVATGILGELQTMSIGIGYSLPFQTVGAAWINGDSLAVRMNKLGLPGLKFTPINYIPYYGTFKDSLISGVQIHITNFRKVSLMKIQFFLLQVIHKMYPNKDIFQQADYSRIKMFDNVLGTDKIRITFTKRWTVSDINSLLTQDVEKFRTLSKKYYLYN